jgi:hypothetical protein
MCRLELLGTLLLLFRDICRVHDSKEDIRTCGIGLNSYEIC